MDNRDLHEIENMTNWNGATRGTEIIMPLL
jgi:hypothetical protein